MKIKDVCLRTGLTDRTIRFYIEKGLLNVNANDVNGRNYREYTEEDVEWLQDIAKLRKAKFSVQDILDMQNSNENINNIIARHHTHLEQEQLANELIVQKLKDIDDHKVFSWRELAHTLFGDKETEQDTMDFPVCDEPIVIEYSRTLKDYLKIIIPVLLFSIILIIGAIFALRHRYNQRDLMTAICISNVSVHDKWIEDQETFVSVSTNPDTAVGYDNYFFEHRTLHVKNIDYYNALMKENGIYMSMTIEIEIPYIEAKKNKLLDIANHIDIESVLSSQDYIKSYCTITSVMQDMN